MGHFNKNTEKFDSLTIGSGHSILTGYIPPSIPKEEFVENFYKWNKVNPEIIQKFGLFGSDIDYNTYYPNLPAEELNPKSDEFIEPMFRLLSATIVSKNWNPTDFSNPGVLKSSMKLLLGQTVNCDHETNIGNAIGAVSQVVWQEAYKDGNFTIPAGINGILKIDGKANPRIARGILMEPPSIHSNSVTVQFKWDKSHPELDDDEFYQKLGTYDSKGKMVRRMVTEVVRYLETSLVSHGADTFAQKIGADGKIVNPEFAKRTWQSYEEYRDDKSKNFFFNDYKIQSQYINETQVNLNEKTKDPVNNITNQKDMNELEKFIEAITASGMLQLAEGVEATQENILESLKEVISDRDQLKTQKDTLESEKTSLNEKITNLEATVANLKEMATVGTNHLTSLRESVVANYKKLKGDKVDETIVTMINSAGINTLESLNNDYMQQLDEKFPLTCSKCGSHEVTRASSQKSNEDTTNNEELNTDVFDDLYHSKIK